MTLSTDEGESNARQRWIGLLATRGWHSYNLSANANL